MNIVLVLPSDSLTPSDCSEDTSLVQIYEQEYMPLAEKEKATVVDSVFSTRRTRKSLMKLKRFGQI